MVNGRAKRGAAVAGGRAGGRGHARFGLFCLGSLPRQGLALQVFLCDMAPAAGLSIPTAALEKQAAGRLWLWL